jgi:integrase
MSVVDFWEQMYLLHIQLQKRPSTVEGYSKMWSCQLKDRLEGIAVRDFRTRDAEGVLQDIAEDAAVCTTTLKHLKHLMSGIFRYAIRTGVLNGVNPIQATCIPDAEPAGETHAYTLDQVLAMIRILPQPARAVIAIAGFAGLRKGEIRGLKVENYDGSALAIRRSAWKKHVGLPKGKRGTGYVPLIPTAAAVLDEHLKTALPKGYIFQTLKGGPADLDFMVREAIRPALKKAGLPWYGLHAFRRGLATNLHELGVADIVIQAILRHSDVSVTRRAYIKNDGVDARSQAAMEALEIEICTKHAPAPVATQ